jgi:hypothetical protein
LATIQTQSIILIRTNKTWWSAYIFRQTKHSPFLNSTSDLSSKKNASDLISKQKQKPLLVPFHVIAMDPENWSTVSGGMAGSFGNGA